MHNDSTALLPTGTRINPLEPAGATYYDPEQVGYLLRGGVNGQDRRVLATSSGSLGEAWAPGTRHRIHHDQTGGNFGEFEVISVYAKGVLISGKHYVGKTVPHYVFK